MFPEHHDFSEIRDMRGTAGKCKRMGEYNYCGKCDRRYPENSFDVWMEAQRNTADLTPADNLL